MNTNLVRDLVSAAEDAYNASECYCQEQDVKCAFCRLYDQIGRVKQTLKLENNPEPPASFDEAVNRFVNLLAGLDGFMGFYSTCVTEEEKTTYIDGELENYFGITAFYPAQVAVMKILDERRAALDEDIDPRKWITWNGGELPDKFLDCYVEVKLRNGRTFKCYAKMPSWTHLGDQTDIVAFRATPLCP